MNQPLKINLTNELLELENFIIHRSCDIEQWFRIKWLENQAPFYGSVDLRNSGFKLAPVDMNLFPGGFNNLNPDFAPLAVQAASVASEKVCSEAKKVLIIGSGPIVIGQACEFDYAGSQSLRSLREDGIETILINSNPATIMTDPSMADHVYLKPLTTKSIIEILKKHPNNDAV